VVELTQEELAATLALSRQTVSRALHDLAHAQVIKQERRRIRLIDLEKLRERLPRWRDASSSIRRRFLSQIRQFLLAS
jgi:DNA-binding transcriptional regulator YhcF (GntR family)